MRTLRSFLIPMAAVPFVAATTMIPAWGQQPNNVPNASSPAATQPQNNGQQEKSQPVQSYYNGVAAQQQNPNDASPCNGPVTSGPTNNVQTNGSEMQPPPENAPYAPAQQQQSDCDPGRIAVEQVDSAPPPLPPDAYDQPPMPGDGYVWTPGYWNWSGGWSWMPGVWVYPPYVGALWTPGYWGWYGGAYGWYPGYWGMSIGFYGGIYYGGGYWGRGFYGGYWHHGHYYNNRNVNYIGNRGYHSYNGPRYFRGRQSNSSYYRRAGSGNRSGNYRGFNGATNRTHGTSTLGNPGMRNGRNFGGAPTRTHNMAPGSRFGGTVNQSSRHNFSGNSISRGSGTSGFSSARGNNSNRGFSGVAPRGNSGFHGGGFHGGGGGGFHGGGGGGFHGGGGRR